MPYINHRGKRLPFILSYPASLFRFRDLTLNLVGSDLRSRFRRSRLGILWAILQPLGFSLMLALVWGALFKSKTFWEFAIYTFSGLIVWEFFVATVMGGLVALMNAAGYLKQSRIPLLVFQIRVPLTALVIFLFAIIGLFGLMGALAVLPPLGLHYLYVALFPAVMLFLMVPLAILFSLLGAQFRDTQHIMTLVVQGLFFISPVMLPREVLAEPQLAWLQYINPMVSLLDLFRDPLLHGLAWSSEDVIVVSAWGAGLWMLAAFVSARFGRQIVFAL